MNDMKLSESDEVLITGSRDIRRLCNAVAVINVAKEWLPELELEIDGNDRLAIRMKDVLVCW